jgi:two-component system cell cycle response regulator CtrA
MESAPSDGLALIRRLRQSDDDTPLLALTGARSCDRSAALRLGADDAMSDPVDPADLDAHIIALIRRSPGFSESERWAGDLCLHMKTHQVRFGTRTIRLTGKEFAILALLMDRNGLVITKPALHAHLFGVEEGPAMAIIDLFICKLRTKLEAAGAVDVLRTVWGQGYMMRDAGVRPRPAAVRSRREPRRRMVA